MDDHDAVAVAPQTAAPPDDATTQWILAEEQFLHGLALRLSGRHADADDLVQEAMLRAFVARQRFRAVSSMRAWLATILMRLFLTAVLKDKRRATRTDTDAGGPLRRSGGPLARHEATPQRDLEQFLDHVDDSVRNALLQLPDIYRAPFVLFALNGLSYADIAARLQIPIGTVMSRIHRARRHLQRMLEGYVGSYAPRRHAALPVGVHSMVPSGR